MEYNDFVLRSLSSLPGRSTKKSMQKSHFSIKTGRNPMKQTQSSSRAGSASRRRFLKTSIAASAAGAFLSRNAYPAGNDLLRVGLIGCGGRGTGAAAEALAADPNVKLVAMGDAFADHIETSLAQLQQDTKIAGKIDVPPERRFSGFDNFKHVIDSVDVVLLAEPRIFVPCI
jgi:myo-inositol 2-dehydrogenase/D-chiro-inositol 1-dehydrogenase